MFDEYDQVTFSDTHQYDLGDLRFQDVIEYEKLKKAKPKDGPLSKYNLMKTLNQILLSWHFEFYICRVSAASRSENCKRLKDRFGDDYIDKLSKRCRLDTKRPLKTKNFRYLNKTIHKEDPKIVDEWARLALQNSKEIKKEIKKEDPGTKTILYATDLGPMQRVNLKKKEGLKVVGKLHEYADSSTLVAAILEDYSSVLCVRPEGEAEFKSVLWMRYEAPTVQ